MLKRLTISNYALIDVLDTEFPEHLVIITGDSGAGKSIMLGAISFLLGGKADAATIKDPSRNCVVEAQFDDHIVRRVLTPAGRSRVFIDDEPANLEQVRSLAAQEIDIHSQNSQMLLGDASFRLSVVDSFAGNSELLEQYRAAYNTCTSLKAELEQLQQEIRRREREREYTQFRYDQLLSAGLNAGELEQAEERQKTLANAGQIKETLSLAVQALAMSETPVEQQLKDIVRSLQKLSGVYPAAEELARRLESCRIEIKDIADTLDEGQEKIDSSSEALSQLEARIAEIYDLMRRNDASSESELISIRDAYAKELEDTDSLQEEQQSLSQAMAKADAECEDLCVRLGASRQKVLEPLSNLLQHAVRELDMPQAQFKVVCEPLPQRGRNGRESVSFLFSSTTSGALQEAAGCASGGEMSRIMLCIKHLLAQKAALPTVIFDEIDTGMSGSLADKIGRKIVEISKNIQVIAITHLPQVAAKGATHYLVYKEYLPEGAYSRIKEIKAGERESEIARMISGSNISAEALAAARVLLSEAN